LSLLRYLQALEPATPRWERDPSLRRSLGAGTEALAWSPVNPYAWYQVAQVRSALEQPASEVVSALEMSMLTGRVEPNLLLPRIELGATYLSSLDDGQRAQVSDQVGLAMQLKRSQILRSVRDGRLDFEALRQLAPPGLEAELDTMEKRLGPAS
jgi:hypothetical protein